MLNYVLAPATLEPSSPLYHFVGGFLDKDTKTTCDAHCAFGAMVGWGARVGNLAQ
jgi:hypothetical protein